MEKKEIKYKIGDIVYDRTRPSQQLVITKHQFNTYYCQPVDNPRQRALVFFEADLMGESINELKLV